MIGGPGSQRDMDAWKRVYRNVDHEKGIPAARTAVMLRFWSFVFLVFVARIGANPL